MAIENETADQVVRMMLQGSEVILRLTGEAALRIAPMIYAALKDGHTTKGKATLWEFLKSGKDQKMFRISDEYLKAFTTASKKFGFPFVVLKDKSRTDGLTDIMVYATDASKVSRVIEKFNLMVKQAETIKPEIKTDSGELVKPLGMQLAVPLSLIDGIPDPPVRADRAGKRDLDRDSPVVQDAVEENVIDRGEDGDLFGGGRELADRRGDRGDDARREDQPVGFDRVVVPRPPPVAVGFTPFFVGVGIAEDTELVDPSDGFADGGGGFKIHVGDPHRELTVADIPFDRAGAAAVDGCVEVKRHG